MSVPCFQSTYPQLPFNEPLPVFVVQQQCSSCLCMLFLSLNETGFMRAAVSNGLSLCIILVLLLQMIDEVHTLIGAGAAEGAIDAANILKPALARGELQCIGATTLDEYRKHIEKDPALERLVA